MPPKDAASLKVTKSPFTAPCPDSVTVMVASPLDAEKVASPALVVNLMGVISLKVVPSCAYNFLCVPKILYCDCDAVL